ncbi:GNAT family N-acetyltransferase [Leifsonia sp. ZF2019]|uniref:GNAT family N-acetyltransferase n=1 Tax=Leifsonia sp. ZF2019 TaxID=2781978 RepID=UPI001CBD1EBD|nr:GNAT family N-acetyltransferase [Leifsonia sp. ZF2019]UAJ81166.1 GNAT family N-acetyltransferase [Leifsonia sp. ZF2019]
MAGRTIEVRPATVADAPGIAHVHVTAWREAYARQVPAEYLAALDTDRRATSWATLIASGTTGVQVAESGGAIVGWASTGTGRDADAPVPLELEGLYTLASVYGSGAGQRLLDAAIGSADAYLWVMADNPRARTFYARNGFRSDGSTKVETIGATAVEVVRLLRTA